MKWTDRFRKYEWTKIRRGIWYHQNIISLHCLAPSAPRAVGFPSCKIVASGVKRWFPAVALRIASIVQFELAWRVQPFFFRVPTRSGGKGIGVGAVRAHLSARSDLVRNLRRLEIMSMASFDGKRTKVPQGVSWKATRPQTQKRERGRTGGRILTALGRYHLCYCERGAVAQRLFIYSSESSIRIPQNYRDAWLSHLAKKPNSGGNRVGQGGKWGVHIWGFRKTELWNIQGDLVRLFLRISDPSDNIDFFCAILSFRTGYTLSSGGSVALER